MSSPRTGAAVKPVVLSSIVAPRSKGSLAVLVKNAAGQPVPGLTVTAPPATSKTTNSAGCAVFSQLEAGNYTVGLNQANYVDRNGDPAPTKLAGVTAGNLTNVEFAYDRAASINVLVQTEPTASGGVVDPARTILAANSGLTTGLRTWYSIAPVPAPPVPYPTDTTVTPAVPTGSTFPVTRLFPFPEGYTFYSGNCLNHDPSKFVSGYFSSHTGAVTLAPGASAGRSWSTSRPSRS